jgi:hypothetical protein
MEHSFHSFHSFSELFKQLGLGNDNQEIENFLREHAPLPADMFSNKNHIPGI